MEKNTERIHKFWDSKTFSRNSEDLDKTTRLLSYISVLCMSVIIQHVLTRVLTHLACSKPMLK